MQVTPDFREVQQAIQSGSQKITTPRKQEISEIAYPSTPGLQSQQPRISKNVQLSPAEQLSPVTDYVLKNNSKQSLPEPLSKPLPQMQQHLQAIAVQASSSSQQQVNPLQNASAPVMQSTEVGDIPELSADTGSSQTQNKRDEQNQAQEEIEENNIETLGAQSRHEESLVFKLQADQDLKDNPFTKEAKILNQVQSQHPKDKDKNQIEQANQAYTNSNKIMQLQPVSIMTPELGKSIKSKSQASLLDRKTNSPIPFTIEKIEQEDSLIQQQQKFESPLQNAVSKQHDKNLVNSQSNIIGIQNDTQLRQRLTHYNSADVQRESDDDEIQGRNEIVIQAASTGSILKSKEAGGMTKSRFNQNTVEELKGSFDNPAITDQCNSTVRTVQPQIRGVRSIPNLFEVVQGDKQEVGDHNMFQKLKKVQSVQPVKSHETDILQFQGNNQLGILPKHYQRISIGSNSSIQFDDNNYDKRLKESGGSQIEEEMTFEELSSKLGGIPAPFQQDNNIVNFAPSSIGNQHFNDMNSSAQISICTSQDYSGMQASKNKSLDFQNLPALLQFLDGQLQLGEHLAANTEMIKAKFEYENRFFNHFNVNKMTYESQAYATIHRGSFAENIEKRLDRQDYTGDSENVSPVNPRLIDRAFLGANQSAIPVTGIQSQIMMKGLEEPNECSNLYDNFDIHHEGLSYTDNTGFCEEAMKSMETQRTVSEGTNRALIPETGIEKKTYPSNREQTTSSGRNYGQKKIFDLTKDNSDLIGERLKQILEMAVAGSTIKLPAQEIEMPNITIKKNFIIVGQPGTCLFFKTSLLSIDFLKSEDEKIEIKQDFLRQEPVIFSEIQFKFSIDLRVIAYKQNKTKQTGGVGGLSVNSVSSKQQTQQAIQANHHQSRALVQLISIKSGTKAEFRDCSFRCIKVYNPRQVTQNTQVRHAAGATNNLIKQIRSERSHSRSANKKGRAKATSIQQQDIVDNASVNRQDSISVGGGTSEKQLNDSFQYPASTSGRILGKFFTNEKEEEQVLRENIHEVCFWMNADAMNEHPSCQHEFSANYNRFLNSGSTTRINKKPYKASLMLLSCVFTGFYNQVRAGCNATIEVDKCYMQESMSSAMMLVNPCYFRMIESNLIRTQVNSGVNIRWLSDSIDKHISRVIEIKQNDFGLNYYCGVEIQGNVYSAHNVKIDISKNCMYRNKKEGLLIQNLAVTAILIYGNEFSKNEGDNLKMTHVHNKVNRSHEFRVENCQIEYSKGGFGANFYDSSFVIKNCIIKCNQNGGIFCGCPEKPKGLVDDAIIFLKKFPMCLKISNCEITGNMHYGVLVQDFWKGSVIIKHTLVQYNCNFGVYMHAKEPPKERMKSLQRSLHIFSAEKVLEDVSAIQATPASAAHIFRTINPNPQRRSTNPVLNQQQNQGVFNVSNNSQGGPLAISNMRKSNLRNISNFNEKGTNDLQLINLKKINPSENIDIVDTERLQKNQQQQQQIETVANKDYVEEEDRDQQNDSNIPTMRNLITRENQSQSQQGFFKNQLSLKIQQQQQNNYVDHIHDSRSVAKDSPVKKQNTSLASSIMASLRRRKNNNKNESQINAKKISFLNQNSKEEADQNEMTRKFTIQMLMQMDQKLVMEKQELGKIYIIGGTGIIKNGGAGVAVRHCYLEIDNHPKTRVQDNDFGYQVYVMLKQCQKLLTGFDQAMIEGRIRGRKVLVGGGWGQVTPQMPAHCCRGLFKPCLKFVITCCNQKKNKNKILDNPNDGEQQVVQQLNGGGPIYDTSPDKRHGRFRASTLAEVDPAKEATQIKQHKASKTERPTQYNSEIVGKNGTEQQQQQQEQQQERKCVIF